MENAPIRVCTRADAEIPKFGIMREDMFFLQIMFAALLTNCADVAKHVCARQTGARFDLTGQVFVRDNNGDPILGITDTSGSTRIMGVRHVVMPLPFKSGDTIRATGIIDVPPDTKTHLPCAICRSVRFVAEGTPPPPVRASAADILSGLYDCRAVCVKGRVRQVVRDEIDARCIYVQLLVDDSIVYLTAYGGASFEARFRSIIDAEIDVNGICMPPAYIRRRFIGHIISILNMKDIDVLSPAPQNPYYAPILDANMVADAATINRLGRRRISGTVLAPCANRRVILRTDKDEILDVHLLGDPLPPAGRRIEAVGIPEADCYQINLVDAIWRDASGKPSPAGEPQDIAIEQLLTDGKGNDQINSRFHGTAIRTSGTLIDLPTPESGRNFAILKDKGGTILLDISCAKQVLGEVSTGCKIAVSGICTINKEYSTPQLQRFQRLNGVTLVVRNPGEVTVLSRPPWWTPRRFMAVVGILLSTIAAFFVWNRLLQRVIERKSRQLMREQLATEKATLRIDERTHLAVELHDSLSQNLSGVACQIAATKSTLPDGAENTARYLATAERMLLSCRTELRRCLWDLRENALEEKDFTEAIRKTLAPVTENTRIDVRFDVPRSLLDDTIAHAILCIIRELASNAIHHGKAGEVRIRGDLSGNSLNISVCDDGTGFDLDNAAGATEGHFGIEGVRERIKRLCGTFTIASKPGEGCKATISIPAEN